MSTPEMPFLPETFKGLGTAPALESIELGDDVPIAIKPDEVSREATRYVAFVGDVIIPRQKRERPDLRLGGEYFGQEYKCLIRSKGLVRRCQITPLEIGFDFMGEMQIGDNATGLQVVTQVTQDDKDPEKIYAPSKLNAVQMYPGDEIKGILRGDSNGTNKGFVELIKLAGIPYADFRQSGIQEFIFPEWKKILAGAEQLPVKLSALVTHLNGRRSETQDFDLRDVIDGFLLSAEKFREWGMQYLKYSSMLVRVPAHQGFVHTYSDLAEMLFGILEVRREDVLADAATQAAFNNAQSGAISGEDAKNLMQMLADNQKLIIQLMTGKAPKVETVPEVQADTNLAGATGDGRIENPVILDPTKCEVITGSGKQCSNDAGPDGRCSHPAHALPKAE